MAKAEAPRCSLDSYTVKHINKTIKAGDCVLMQPSDPSKPSYVARIEGIESDAHGANVKVHVRWYYRPEESIGGRRQFYGSKASVRSTLSRATRNRFEYNFATGAFNPDRVAVYV